ncbi:MAG: MFS transporter [Oscillatoriales cyanobacterium SM2_2_1]|nr:MFS transporter [Oscillatoriales cyanobacterium SM2_2_1]
MNTAKLPFSTKLAYGAGDLGTAIAANLITFFLLPFFTDIAGLKPSAGGMILLVGKLWDAVNDPIIGYLTDRTRSPLGRRRSWMAYAAIPLGLSFLGCWWVPFPGNETALLWYYGVIALLFNTFYTAVNLPYSALTPELTRDYHERTSLNNFRFAFSIGGSLVSAVLHLRIIALFTDPALGWLVAGLFWAVIVVLPTFWCVAGTRERYQQPPTDLPLGQQVAIAFRNRAYLCVIGIYICSWLALQLTATIIPYFVTYWMRPEKPGEVIPLVILAVQGMAFVGLFGWSWLSQRWDKRSIYVAGMSVWIVAQGGLFLLQPQQITAMYALSVVAGIGVSAGYLIPWSMMPDVIELDELETGERREGIFYGFMVLLQKIALAVSLYGVGLLLDGAGFILPQNNQPVLTQPPAVFDAVRALIAPLPALLLVGGIAIGAVYPITREKYAEIRARIAARNQSAASE